MTEAQYFWGWITYLVGATGCLFSLWFIVRRWHPRIHRMLMLISAALVYIPWPVKTGEPFLAPAFLVSLYDGLGLGVDTMWRSGQIALIAAVAACVIGLLLPVRKKPVKKKATTKNISQPKRPNSGKQRKEPAY